MGKTEDLEPVVPSAEDVDALRLILNQVQAASPQWQISIADIEWVRVSPITAIAMGEDPATTYAVLWARFEPTDPTSVAGKRGAHFRVMDRHFMECIIEEGGIAEIDEYDEEAMTSDEITGHMNEFIDGMSLKNIDLADLPDEVMERLRAAEAIACADVKVTENRSLMQQSARFQLLVGTYEVGEPSAECVVIAQALETRRAKVISQLRQQPEIESVSLWKPDAVIKALVEAAAAGQWVGQEQGHKAVFGSAILDDQLAEMLGVDRTTLDAHLERMANEGAIVTAAGRTVLLPADWTPPAQTWDLVTGEDLLAIIDEASRDHVVANVPQLQQTATVDDAFLMRFFQSDADDGLSL